MYASQGVTHDVMLSHLIGMMGNKSTRFYTNMSFEGST